MVVCVVLGAALRFEGHFLDDDLCTQRAHEFVDGAIVPVADEAVADLRVEDGPPMIKSENARLNGWIYVDIEGRDIGSYVVEAQRIVNEQVKLPAGYSIAWSGQYEYMVRAKERLLLLVPMVC